MSSHNILDKIDKSLAPNPSVKAGSTAKRARYNWTSAGKPGDFLMIHKSHLNIDGRYQRDEVSKSKVMEIARNWDWLLIGTISVILREDQSYWVFDGGHRTRASFYRDDITHLPCMVHIMDDLSDEAKAFVARNTMITNVSSFDRYRASVCAGEPTACQVAELLKSLNIEVIDGAGSSKYQLMAIGAVQKMVARNVVLARRVIEFLMSIECDKSLPSSVLLGVFMLCDRMQSKVDILRDYGEKLGGYGVRGLETKIRQFVTEIGRGGEMMYAKAILDLVNKGKRHKIEW